MKASLKKVLHKIPLQQNRPLQKIMIIGSFLLVMLCFALPGFAQSIRVKGRVTNENGQPVARASVTVKGSTAGATADDNGSYEITAPSNGTLVISAVNFTTQEVRVNNRQTVDISLVSLEKTESEVIVVGYGTARKKDVTGAVVSIKSETLREVPAPNLIAQLKGRTAGVDIISNGSTPGSSGQIRIRGNRTLATSANESNNLDQPLIVLDGIPYGGSINDINPDDVSSLEILKDASATAIYGSRGAGGVILISTRRGRAGKSVTSYDGYHGITDIMGKLRVFNGPEYAKFKTDAAIYNRTAPGTTGYGLTTAEQAALTAGISTDWQDLIYQQGFITSHQLSVSGGTTGTQFGLGGGYFKEEGIIPNQTYERYTLRATIDHQANKRIKIGLNTLNTLSYSNTPGGGGVTNGLVRLTPLAAPYNPDGTLNLLPQVGSIDAQTINPLTLLTREKDILAKNRRIRTFNSLYAEVSIIEGLKYRLNLGLDYSQASGNGYSPSSTWVNNNTAQSSATATVNDQESWVYNIQNLLTYNRTFAQKHRIDFTGLFEVQKNHDQARGFQVQGLPADYIQNTNFGLAANAINVNGGNFFSERGLVSVMARVNYGYDNRYLLTATIRRDGSSVLAPGHQYFTYPSFSLGWNAMNETFMQNISFISALKLRGGWGITSNQGVDPYATLGALTASTYNFGQGTAGQQAAYTVTTLANSELKWQSTSQWNVGLDFGVFKNRLTGSIDVYQQKTKDILLNFGLPPSNGATSTRKNLGKTQGNGLEINLSSVNVQTKTGFTWSTDLNFYFNREKITYLTAPGEKQNIGNGWFVGHPLTVIYDVKKIGIWQTDDSVKGILAQQITPVQFPGQIRIQDLNKDGRIDQNDRQIIGNFQPQWEGGITNRVAYKNFDLSIVIFARMGMKVLVPYVTADGGAQGFPFFMQARNNQLKVNYWTRTNPTNDFPAPDAGTDRFPFGSTLGIMDGSFIKCRSINLGYAVPLKVLSKAGINSLRVYVNVTNPFIIYSPFVRDEFGPDPEGNGYGGSVGSPLAGSSTGTPARQVSVNANNPSVRQFILGLNLKF